MTDSLSPALERDRAAPDRRRAAERRVRAIAPKELEQRASDRRSAPHLSYPLSGLQAGMLYEHLAEPDTGANINQLIVTLPESVDVEQLRRAWQGVMVRHAVLRTAIAWDGLPNPEQRVFADVELPWEVVDLRHADGSSRARLLQDFLDTDRLRGFRLDRPPLIRLALLRMADDHYELVWTLHHIVLDGRSRTMVLREAFACYDAACRDEPYAPPPPPEPYCDFISYLAGRDLAAAQEFWTAALHGFVTPTSVAGVRPPTRLPVAGPRNHLVETCLGMDTSAALKAIARDNGLTLTTLVHGAWALLLSRHSGEADVAFGVVRAGRRTGAAGADGMVGMLINTLPLRALVAPDAALLPWLVELRDRWRAMRAHEQTPLSTIQRGCGIAAGNALFETIVMVENQSFDQRVGELGPAWAARSCRTISQSGLPLMLQVFDEPEITIDLWADRTRIDEMAAARALRHFRTILEAIASNPAGRLAELPILEAEERHRLLVDWNRTDRPVPSDSAVPELIARQASRTPDAVAVRGEDVALTYRELLEDAEHVAAHLRSLGVGSGTMVGLFLERSPDLVVGMLGIMLAGAAYVPVDPIYPPDRIQDVFADASVTIVLNAAVLNTARTEAKPLGAPPTIDAEDLAYVIFTSGSTGRPKGVQIPHGALVNFLVAMAERPGLAATDTLLAVTTPAFDISGLELLLPLTVGATTVVAPTEVLADGLRLAALLESSGATVMQATPATWRLMFESGWSGQAGLKVLCGGEALPVELASRILECGMTLWNMYGPTETTVWSAVGQVLPGGPITIGAPIANTQLYVLDASLEPVPIDVPGELYIGGAGLARGYLNRPELTAERFVPNPFGPEGTRLYRTGDLVRRRDDGTLDFLGRVDDQIKLRGFRIELGEIESVLAEAPGVAATAVAVHRDGTGDPRLVGYYVAEAGANPDDQGLKEVLRRRLPDYMVPAVLVRLPALPLTPAGKLDRKALPAPGAPVRRHDDEGTDNVRDELARIWEQLLGIPRAGIYDSFFDLGGHSLLAVRLLQEIKHSFGRSLALSDLFHEPTIDRLATLLAAEALPAADQNVMVELRGGSGTPLFFLHGDFAFGGLYCQRLLRCIPNGHPIYALHPHQPGGPATVMGMAADYADRIQAVQPHGPYRLAGVCNGGIIAFELARQLERRGEKTDLLAMIDARAGNVALTPILRMLDRGGQLLGWNGKRRRQYVAWHRAGFVRMLNRFPFLATGRPWLRRVMAAVVLGQLALQGGWRRLLRLRPRAHASSQPETAATPRSPIEIGQALRGQFISDATGSYVPAAFGGAVTLIWGQEEFLALRRDQLLGWEGLARQVHLRVIPGGHHTILTRHLPALGASLAELLANTDARTRRWSGPRRVGAGELSD